MNPVMKSACNNSRPFIVPDSTCDQRKNSFFVWTVIDWNQLDNKVVALGSVDSFKRAIGRAD